MNHFHVHFMANQFTNVLDTILDHCWSVVQCVLRARGKGGGIGEDLQCTDTNNYYTWFVSTEFCDTVRVDALHRNKCNLQ